MTLNYARENWVEMLCFLPHCAHRLQPLDVTLMRPISMAYSDEIKRWHRSNPGQSVVADDILRLFSAVFTRAARPETIVREFKTTGIWPFNKNIFSDDDFRPAEVTDRPYSPQEQADEYAEQCIESLSQDLARNLSLDAADEEAHCSYANIHRGSEKKAHSGNLKISIGKENLQLDSSTEWDDEPGCSTAGIATKNRESFLVTPQEILPRLAVDRTKPRKNRRRGKTALLKSSPYRQELENKQTAQKKGSIIQKPATKRAKLSTTVEESYEDASCLFCEQLYSTSTESWVQCTQCKLWADSECAGVDNADVEYTCDFCE